MGIRWSEDVSPKTRHLAGEREALEPGPGCGPPPPWAAAMGFLLWRGCRARGLGHLNLGHQWLPGTVRVSEALLVTFPSVLGS